MLHKVCLNMKSTRSRGHRWPPEPYYTPSEVAAELNVTPRWVYELLLTGALAGYQPNGRHWRIRPAELRRYRRRPPRRRGPGKGAEPMTRRR